MSWQLKDSWIIPIGIFYLVLAGLAFQPAKSPSCDDLVNMERGRMAGKAAREAHWQHLVGCLYGVEVGCNSQQCKTVGFQKCQTLFPDAPIMQHRRETLPK